MSLKQFNKSEALSATPIEDRLPQASLSHGRDYRSEFLKREQSFDNGHASKDESSLPNDRAGDINKDPNNFPSPKKRKLKGKAAKSKLSFAADDDGDEANAPALPRKTQGKSPNATVEPSQDDEERSESRLGPNVSAGYTPKAITKHALRQEMQRKEALREEFRQQQEAVKAAEIVVPFVFFEGTNSLTSQIRMKKGDTVDVLLSGAQKILVKEDYKKWVHLKLDDLMLVRGGVMIPHYLTIHYFILKGTRGPQGSLFDFSAVAPSEDQRKPDEQPEGTDHDPNLTKIVDVKWYKDHKHIYPCNIWEWFDPHNPSKDYGYAKTARRDAHGNSFFSAG